MNTKALYAAIAVIALLIIGLFLYNQSQDNTLSNTTSKQTNTSTEQTPTNLNSNTSTGSNTSTDSNSGTEGQFSGEGDIAGRTYQIVFDGSKFSPSTLTIKQGDTVVFKNESTGAFWPASGPHPQHTNYPEFDPKKSIAAGGMWSFTFTKTGTWPFHDHLHPSAFGSITVK